MNTRTGLFAIVIALLASLLAVVPVAPSVPVLAQTSPLVVTKSAPGDVLAGEPISYTLTAENTGAMPLYNLSFRDVLAPGVAYVPGSTAPSSAGEPQVITNQIPDTNPGAGIADTIPQQTLVWSNVSDLQSDDEFSVTFRVLPNSTGAPARNDVHVIGAVIDNEGEGYAGTDARRLPTFDDTGVLEPDPSVVVGASPTVSTTLTAVAIEKDSTGAPEGELLRGVHDNVVTYSLTVEATDLGSTDTITVTDLIPAQLEFLGCGGQDNGTSGPLGGPAPEYDGAPLLSATAPLTPCVTPGRVETVTNPTLGGITYSGVHTLVEWTLPTVAPGAPVVLRYRAGIPLFANELFPAGQVPPTDGTQGSNLDNNTGASTREQPLAENAVTNIARVESVRSSVSNDRMIWIASSKRLTRVAGSSRSMPYAWCSLICQPAPMPSTSRPFEIRSIVAARLARIAG